MDNFAEPGDNLAELMDSLAEPVDNLAKPVDNFAELVIFSNIPLTFLQLELGGEIDCTWMSLMSSVV